MKRLKTLLLAITLFFGGLTMVNAQSKVAHVNTQEITKTFPAFLQAQQEAEKAGQAAAKATADASKPQYDDMVKSYKETSERYNKEAGTQTDAINQARGKELQQMQTAIYQQEQLMQENIQVSAQKAQYEAMLPVRKRMMEAIDKVAKTLGYDYVLDVASLVVANGTDITAEVKKELGM
ncbi:hypothetical protein BTO05_07180 [Winogradskyella sp. PC-19]|uniref:OmpH family outer membrane protein n=1 Tax=unclassified Winogradskyella TaxID=2615021 RepID=UPI000B3D2397|nr:MULTISPECIES: OmpH family outer membrane protein [unclassified Winogradskyella]ARV09431.1 hypothetical protein BTO05_07180 [Winogradskyella sp. PC-19]RZN83954.1 MAG: OmpH family outer membrane protein [Winogradskyella sp.]